MTVDSGLGDSSGIEGVWVQTFVERFPDVQRTAASALEQKSYTDAARAANRVWNLQTADGEITLDIATCTAVTPDRRQTSLWEIFEKNGRSVWPVVAWLDERI